MSSHPVFPRARYDKKWEKKNPIWQIKFKKFRDETVEFTEQAEPEDKYDILDDQPNKICHGHIIWLRERTFEYLQSINFNYADFEEDAERERRREMDRRHLPDPRTVLSSKDDKVRKMAKVKFILDWNLATEHFRAWAKDADLFRDPKDLAEHIDGLEDSYRHDIATRARYWLFCIIQLGYCDMIGDLNNKEHRMKVWIYLLNNTIWVHKKDRPSFKDKYALVALFGILRFGPNISAAHADVRWRKHLRDSMARLVDIIFVRMALVRHITGRPFDAVIQKAFMVLVLGYDPRSEHMLMDVALHLHLEMPLPVSKEIREEVSKLASGTLIHRQHKQ